MSDVVLNLVDECTADPERRPPPYRVVGSELEIRGDSILVDGRPVLVRLDPVGFGDVHWELVLTADGYRYTTIQLAVPRSTLDPTTLSRDLSAVVPGTSGRESSEAPRLISAADTSAAEGGDNPNGTPPSQLRRSGRIE